MAKRKPTPALQALHDELKAYTAELYRTLESRRLGRKELERVLEDLEMLEEVRRKYFAKHQNGRVSVRLEKEKR